MSSKPQTNSSGLKPTPVETMTFKVDDLRRDVDCLKSTYDGSADPNKTRIERVLSNMERKLVKGDQMLKFGRNAVEYSVAQDRTKAVLKRVHNLKQLFKDLIKGQRNMSAAERRSMSQMFHQLLSMEEDLVHFADPGNRGKCSGKCRSNDEPRWTPAKDCEVQVALLEDVKLDEIASSKATAADFERIVCCTYPEIEESSDYGEEETRTTVFSIADLRSEQLTINGNCASYSNKFCEPIEQCRMEGTM